MNYDSIPINKSFQDTAPVKVDNGSFSNSPTNSSSEKELKKTNRLESIGFWVFLATIILAPLSFWTSPYVSLDLIKTFVIAIGSIVSVILFSFVAIKERRLVLPPAKITWTSILIIISLIVSSFLSIHLEKAFFGQGFEIGNASFLIVLFFAALVSFVIVSKQRDRAVVLYTGIIASYAVVFLLHVLRLIFGADFMTLGFLNSATSSIVGTWYSIGLFSMIVAIVLTSALSLLKLPIKMKIVYWFLLVVSILGTMTIAQVKVWQMAAALIFLGLTVFLSVSKFNFVKKTGEGKSFFKSIAWIPFVIFLLTSVLAWKMPSFINSTVGKVNAGYVELSLPWQMTLDVTASVIQNYPLFGIGPNNFTKAFLAYKPMQINTTDFWGAEFSNGFGLIPTFIVTQGIVGMILWIIFFVFLGIIATKVLKNLPEENDKRFMIISSFAVSLFLWIVAFVSVPSHVILFYTFIVTGIFIGLAVSEGILSAKTLMPIVGSKTYKVFPSLMAVVVLVSAVWGLVYLKKTIALSYFSDGMEVLTQKGDPEAANIAFSKAIKLDSSDLYWQAKAEADLVLAQKLAATVTSTTTASTSQAILEKISQALNQGMVDAKKATEFDPTNYYNYLSEARIAEAATNIGMANGYENTVKSYNSAIGVNPFNPSIYLSLASFEARQKKYDDALKDLGKSLQVKENYLDAVFLISQVYAAKGDAANAIIAAKVAVEINPNNSLLWFQLGILDYSNKDFAGAAQALEKAIKIQPDYANAKYFLGLSYARLNETAKAVAQFEDLAKTNPDNQEVVLILSTLKSGKSIFGDTKAAVTNAPEKRSSLPIKEKTNKK